MKTPQLPDNEIKRILTLKQLDILDTIAEEAFDDLTMLASIICDTPIALITLVDETRQWFKSVVGLKVKETPRDVSFCGHAILGNHLFEVQNALNDERFDDNPLVIGDPNIRFYAGMPLVTMGGYALGTLCVIDTVERKLTPKQRDGLTKLAHQVILKIENKLNSIRLDEIAKILEKTGEISKTGGWEFDLRTKQIQWTKEVFHIHELEGPAVPDIETALSFYPDSAKIKLIDVMEQSRVTGAPWDLELPLTTAKGKQLWVRTQGLTIVENGEATRLIGVLQDITARKTTEINLAWVNRALLILSECNETIIHIEDEHKLITEICRIIVDVGGYLMAWVGYAQNDEYKLVKPQGHFGKTENFLSDIKLSWSENHANGLGPAGKTIRNGKAIAVENIMLDPTYPVKQHAVNEGYLSLVSLPLRNKDHTFGLLAMYSGEVRSYQADEIRLLQDLADNLAAGIVNIRTEKERQRVNKAILNLAKSVGATHGDEFFVELVSSVTETLNAQAGYVARLVEGQQLSGVTLAASVDDKPIANYSYAIPQTTAKSLFGSSDFLIVAENAARDYPTLSMMRFYPYQAFACICLHDIQGKDVGLIFVFFKEPIEKSSYELIRATLKIFASRTVSELEHMEINAQVHEQASLLHKTRDAIVVRDIHNRITFWNKAAEALYGWTESEAINQAIDKLLGHNPREIASATNALFEHDEWAGELKERHKNGALLTIETHWTLVRDQFGQPKSIFAIKSDISDRKLAEEEIRRLAFYDPLTKLPNRRLLVDRLEKAMLATRRTHHYGAVFFLDLDRFKVLNDTLGHDSGDKLLKEVATRLLKCVRETDTISRLGGDEFVVMLEYLSDSVDEAKSQASVIGNKILKSLNKPIDLDGYEHTSPPSIGITLFNHASKSVEEILKQADVAMYRSKTLGRNRFTFF